MIIEFIIDLLSDGGLASGITYERQRGKGKDRQAATRALAYNWNRCIFQCWQTRTPYDEVKYLESLRRKGSPLLSYAAQKPA